MVSGYGIIRQIVSEIAMTLAIEMVGQKYGRLSVLRRDADYIGRAKWVCECECGKVLSVEGRYLRDGRTKSCGCYIKEVHTRHGMSRTRTYRIWQMMKERATNPNRSNAKNYVGRGIGIAPEWLDFDAFLAEMGEAPDGLSIDRIDNDKGYQPGNCRWATSETQANNMRTTVFIEHNGERLSLSQWARKLGVSRGRLAYRLSKGHPSSFILS